MVVERWASGAGGGAGGAGEGTEGTGGTGAAGGDGAGAGGRASGGISIFTGEGSVAGVGVGGFAGRSGSGGSTTTGGSSACALAGASTTQAASRHRRPHPRIDPPTIDQKRPPEVGTARVDHPSRAGRRTVGARSNRRDFWWSNGPRRAPAVVSTSSRPETGWAASGSEVWGRVPRAELSSTSRLLPREACNLALWQVRRTMTSRTEIRRPRALLQRPRLPTKRIGRFNNRPIQSSEAPSPRS